MAEETLGADTIERAWRFAAAAHAGQLVPGTQMPYLLHLCLVVSELQVALLDDRQAQPLFATCIAILHDVLEDTAVQAGSLEGEFGTEVFCGVKALTKDPRIPQTERMRDSLRRVRAQPREVWMVKMADRCANLAKPPDSWTSEKRQYYEQESRLILDELGSANQFLAALLRGRIDRYRSFF